MSYYNGSAYTFTWEGRRLVGATKGSDTMSFTYDDNGIRTSKTVNGVEHKYYLNGSQIVAEEWSDKLLVYLYDASGSPIGMMYRKTSYAADQWDVYWYEKNLQGDIISVYNSAGQQEAYYTYTDAWGNHTTYYTNGGGSTGAQYNPFRYRGYYYDTDLGMYYLQSRYYDAKICRFINADSVMANAGGNIFGNNLFSYCFNNPVNLTDSSGNWPQWISDAISWLGEKIVNPVSQFITGISDDFGNFKISNTNTDVVLNSNYFSGYNGALVIRHSIDNLSSCAIFGIIFLNKFDVNDPNYKSYTKSNKINTLNHEYGHILQEREIGTPTYIFAVAIPSVTVYSLAEDGNFWDNNYYNMPWEYDADRRVGINRGGYPKNINEYTNAYFELWR